jgi:hypothetical protein
MTLSDNQAALRVLAKLEFAPAAETIFDGRPYDLFVLEH